MNYRRREYKFEIRLNKLRLYDIIIETDTVCEKKQSKEQVALF